MSTHDQLFKNLLESFLPDLLAIMLPELAADLEPHSLKFLRDEHFLDPPRGARLQADLLAEIHLRRVGKRARCLIHVEIERQWTAAMPRRLWRYSLAIRRRHPGSLLSLVVYLRGGPSGVRRETWQETPPHRFPIPTSMTFTYWSFALAGCAAEAYLERPEPLAWALAALMQTDMDPERHKLECVRRILHAPVSPAHRYTLLDCVETYLPLNSDRERSFRAMLIEREGPEVLDFYQSDPPWVRRLKKETLEQGVQQGRREGREEGMRRLVTGLLAQRFGPLPEAATGRLSTMNAEQLTALSRRLLTASSLKALGLG